MAKYAIDENTLKRLADALREVSGENRTYTPEEMIEAVATILDSATYILVTPDGQEIPAVFVEDEVVFTADANDIREGVVAATGDGVVTGTKYIPPYNPVSGVKVIPAGGELTVPLMFRDAYNYTAFQALVCSFNTTMANSVSTVKVVIEDGMYSVNSTTLISTIVKDASAKAVKFGATNDTGKPCIIRFFTYKEDV